MTAIDSVTGYRRRASIHRNYGKHRIEEKLASIVYCCSYYFANASDDPILALFSTGIFTPGCLSEASIAAGLVPRLCGGHAGIGYAVSDTAYRYCADSNCRTPLQLECRGTANSP